MPAVKLTAKEVKALRKVLDKWGEGGEYEAIDLILTTAVARVEAPKPEALSAREFCDTVVLHTRPQILLPQNAGTAWYAKLTNLLKMSGLKTTEELVMVLEHVSTWASRPMSAETLAVRAGIWLAEARLKKPAREDLDGPPIEL